MKTVITNAESIREEKTPLYHQYTGQCQPQGSFVEILPGEEVKIIADWNGEIGNAIPMGLWNHRYVRLSVSCTAYGPELADLLDSAKFQSLARRIDAGFDEEWDGNNWVGTYTEDAQSAEEEAESMLMNCLEVEAWSVEDWLFNSCSLAEHWSNQPHCHRR